MGVERFTRETDKVRSIYFGKNHIEIANEQIVINKRKIVYQEKILPTGVNQFETDRDGADIELYPIKQAGAFVMQIH